MDETINQMIAEISAMPLWDADIRAQGYEPVLMCDHATITQIANYCYEQKNGHFKRGEFAQPNEFCGIKVIITNSVHCPVISFIKIFHS